MAEGYQMGARLSRAYADGEITRDELRAGFTYYIGSTSACLGCLSGQHLAARNRVKSAKGDEALFWHVRELEYRQSLQKLNEHIEPYGIRRTFLCYWGHEGSFQKCRAYNLLAKDKETFDMLEAWRYGAPFQLTNENLTIEEAQVAAAAALYSADIPDLNSDQVEELILIAAITNEGNSAEVLDQVQEKLPEGLRIPEDKIDELREKFTRAENLGQAIAGNTDISDKRSTVEAFFNNRPLPSPKINEEVERLQTRQQKAWGIRDKFGKFWRLRSNRWERLSVRYSMSRLANGEPLFTPKIKNTHPGEPGFVPEIDFEQQLKGTHWHRDHPRYHQSR